MTLMAFVLMASMAAPVAGPQAAPVSEGWVTDHAGVLSEDVSDRLAQLLRDLEYRSGHEVLVWIDRSTNGAPIEDFAGRAFTWWQVGREGVDDGIVIFVFTQDGRSRIEVGHGLRGRVPEALASRIARERIAPALRSGDVEGAVTSGVAGVIAALEPTSGGERRRDVQLTKESGGDPWIIKHRFAVGMVVVFLALVVLAKNPSLH